jgi:hypothetical protein
MFTRTITIQANPPQQIVLYYDSRSNAEKQLLGGLRYEDDYGQRVSISTAAVVLSDHVVDVAETYRAQGELEIKQMEAQLRFDERIKKLPTIEAFVKTKRAKAQMANMPRIAMPSGMQQ